MGKFRSKSEMNAIFQGIKELYNDSVIKEQTNEAGKHKKELG